MTEDPKAVLERGAMLNLILDQRNAAWLALRRIASLNSDLTVGYAVAIAAAALGELSRLNLDTLTELERAEVERISANCSRTTWAGSTPSGEAND